ncbi:MAG: hypothetical protein Q4D85_09435 [Corynebacterium sp.]|uniref:hypothetical protein n=1 Tax=Corynebacterium sp. TaxID=1720 RepID=UPI0026DC78A2|nr:hypothetical protein [Corynebacterium sp.]MDO5098971.1 hypothetical protein [Corynebacterium sp.]
MGRLILLLLLILAAYIVWRAFGPHTWNRNINRANQPPQMIKGPDDDENFLWELEKKQFKQRRAQEEAFRQEEERIKRAQQRYEKKPEGGDEPESPEEPPTSTS